MTAVLWLRRDLRRRDHPAFAAAADAADGNLHVVFVIDPALWAGCGPVRRGWLAASIRAAIAYARILMRRLRSRPLRGR